MGRVSNSKEKMMKRVWLVLVVALVFSVASLASCTKKPAVQPQAENASEQKGAKASPAVQATEDLALAGALASYGKEKADPLALLVAAQIIKNTPAQEKEMKKAADGGQSAVSGQKSGALPSAQALLSQAKTMAAGDLQLEELITKEEGRQAPRGPEDGPGMVVERVYPGRTDVYQIVFNGGEPASAVVIGDGDCDLDLYVYDENDHLIGKDTDTTDACIVEWNPLWTGPFTIKVKNYECDVYAEYMLLVGD